MSNYESDSPAPFESKRVPFEKAVALTFEAFSANISMGGMFVRTEQSPQPGSVFEFAFRSDDDVIRGSGEVAWVREDDLGPEAPPGWGIRFRELDSRSQALISRVVERHVRAGGVPFDVDRGPVAGLRGSRETGPVEPTEAQDIEFDFEIETEIAAERPVSRAALALGQPATKTGTTQRETDASPGRRTPDEGPVGIGETPQGVTLDESLEAAIEELPAAPSLPVVDVFDLSTAAPQSFAALEADLEVGPEDRDLFGEREELAEITAVQAAESTDRGASTPDAKWVSSNSDFGTEGGVPASITTKRNGVMPWGVPLVVLAGALLVFLTRTSWLPRGESVETDSRSITAEIERGATTTSTARADALIPQSDGESVGVADGEGEGGAVATSPKLDALMDVADGGPAGGADAIAESATPRPLGGDIEASLPLVRKAVRDWAAAWANQDPETYLGLYSRDFQPAGALSREAWEAQRRQRLTAPRSIEVALSDMDVSLDEDDRINVSFVQRYRSDRYSDVVDKRLELVLEDGQWKIVKEWSTE